MKFRLEEIEGILTAVFEEGYPLRMKLLSHFLHSDPYFVPDMLYEISMVERNAVESSGFHSPHVNVEFFRDRVVIEKVVSEDEDGDPQSVTILLDEAKLLLLEWGVALQRRHFERMKLNPLPEVYSPSEIIATLLILGPAHNSQTPFLLKKGNYVIGRRDSYKGNFPDIDLAPFDEDANVSRCHARIYRQAGQFFVEDLESVNCTFVVEDGKESRVSPKEPRLLHDGTELRFGRVRGRLMLKSSATDLA